MKLDSASLAAASKVDIAQFAWLLQAQLITANLGNADNLDIKAEVDFPLANDGTHDVCVSVRLRCTSTREQEEGLGRDEATQSTPEPQTLNPEHSK